MPKADDRRRRSRRTHRSPSISSSGSPIRRKVTNKSDTKSDKKRRRSPRRPRSPSPDSESSCSTCRARSRSPTPPRKSRKIRKLQKERRASRGRETDKNKGRDKVKSRKKASSRRRRRRSPSFCSTCSATLSSSRSPSLSSDHGSEGFDREINKPGKRAPDALNAKGRDKIIQAYDDFRPLPSQPAQVAESNSIKTGVKDSSQQREAREQDDTGDTLCKEEVKSLPGQYNRGVETRSDADGLVVKNAAARKTELVPINNRDSGSLESSNISKRLVVSGSNLEEHDLEMILRQKALENLMKYRKSSVVVGETVSSSQSDKHDLQSRNPASQVQEQGEDLTSNHGIVQLQPRIRSVVTIPLKDSCASATIDSPSFKVVSNSKRTPVEANIPSIDSGMNAKLSSLEAKIPSRNSDINSTAVMSTAATPDRNKGLEIEKKTTFSNVNPIKNNQRVLQRGANQPLEKEVNLFNGMENDAVEPERKFVSESINMSNEEMLSEKKLASYQEENSIVEGAQGSIAPSDVARMIKGSAAGVSEFPNTGSRNESVADGGGLHFEQKTFSRMHDGETVQVSYKVYIPKKTPALARRKLQR